MKKIIELENRWRSYKYKTVAFRVFIAVFIVFIVFLALFIRFQYNKYTSRNNAPKYAAKHTATQPMPQQLEAVAEPSATQVSQAQDSHDLQPAPTPTARQDLAQDSARAESRAQNGQSGQSGIESVDFVCRRVTSTRLNVRSAASFKSSIVGFYANGAIFCTEKEQNGLLQTNNGWVSGSEAYSEIVEVNMFVDSGFHKNEPTATIAKPPMEEVALLGETPTRYPKTQESPAVLMQTTQTNPQNMVNLQGDSRPQNFAKVEEVKPKPAINISSEKITKERDIEIKQADFKRTNDYGAAIDIARYYYEGKDYANAIKWALSASNAESKSKSKSESWIIYAKSLYAMGEKDQAIELLTKYVSSTNSKDAAAALSNMKQGIL